MKRLCLIHTVPFLIDLFRQKLAKALPELDAFNVVDESLLQDLLKNEDLTPDIVRRIALQSYLAEQAGADLIVFTCSSTSPAVNTVRKMCNIPILKIDDPMAAKAVSIGRKIGIVCTTKSTFTASQNLIKEHADHQGKDVEVAAELESEAFQAIKSGDKQLHDRMIRQAVARISPNLDVVVLAQASMAHLASDMQSELSIPVLSSPDLCIEELTRRIE